MVDQIQSVSGRVLVWYVGEQPLNINLRQFSHGLPSKTICKLNQKPGTSLKFKLARHAARGAVCLIAGIAKGKANRRGKRAKGQEGKLLLGPGETKTSVVVPVIVPSPVRATGVPGLEDPRTPTNAAIGVRRTSGEIGILFINRFLQRVMPLRTTVLPYISAHLPQTKTIWLKFGMPYRDRSPAII